MLDIKNTKAEIYKVKVRLKRYLPTLRLKAVIHRYHRHHHHHHHYHHHHYNHLSTYRNQYSPPKSTSGLK